MNKKTPILLSPSEYVFFKQYVHMVSFEPKIVVVHNCYLTESGICFKHTNLYKQSTFHLDVPISSYRLHSLRRLLTFPKKHYPRGIYTFIHNPWCTVNYHHWLIDSLSRLMPLKDRWHEITLLIPQALWNVPFVQQSLSFFSFKNIEIIPEKTLAYVSNLLFTELCPGGFLLPSTVKPLAEYLIHKIGTLEITLPKYPRIYIDRAKAAGRHLVNTDEIQAVLNEFSYTRICLEEYMFHEQVYLLFYCQKVVSLHGSGIANSIFMQPGAQVAEMHRSLNAPDPVFNHIYWNLASMMGLTYYFISCGPANTQENFHTANLVADISKLRIILEKMEEASA